MTSQHITSAVAGAAIVAPGWLDHLSGGASMALPILGALWLVTQITCRILDTASARRKSMALKRQSNGQSEDT